MALDACTAGGFLRRFFGGCRVAPVCNVRYVPATPCAVPVNSCSTTTTTHWQTSHSQPLYEYPSHQVIYENPIYETPVYQSHSHAAPTCHDCTITACDGMCGDYSSACGGGGVVVNECAGAIDLGYSDCCSAADTGRSYIVDSVSYEHDSVSHGEVINQGSIVDHGSVINHHHEGEVISGETIIHDGTVIDSSNGTNETIVDNATLFQEGAVVEDATTSGASAPADDTGFANGLVDDSSVEPARVDPVPEATRVEPAAGEFATEDVAPIPQPEANDPIENDVSDDLGDDLFGPDTDPMPMESEQDAPVENTPVEDSELDDLFDDVESTPAQPEAAPGGSVDDDLDALFSSDDTGEEVGGGGDFQESTPTDDDLNSLFNDGGDTEEPIDDDDLDSLFDTDANEPDSDLEELFGQNTRLQPVLQEQATHSVSFVAHVMPFRTWSDDTGAYQTVGRLLIIEEDKVRLLKSNGRTCSVGFGRLSNADLEYVRSQIVQYEKSQKVAAR